MTLSKEAKIVIASASIMLALCACAPAAAPRIEAAQAPSALTSETSRLNVPQETSPIPEIEAARAKVAEILGADHTAKYMETVNVSGVTKWIVIDANVLLGEITNHRGYFSDDKKDEKTAALATKLQNLVESNDGGNVTLKDINFLVNGPKQEAALSAVFMVPTRPEYEKIGLLVGHLELDGQEPYKNLKDYGNWDLCPFVREPLSNKLPVVLDIGK